jgi:hypothetical protein
MNPALRLYLLSRFCAGTAMTLMRASLLWHVWSLTHDEAKVGLLGVFMLVPGVSLALVGGAVADAYDRKRIVQLAQSTAVLASLTLCITTALRGNAHLAHLYATGAVLSLCAAFENPSRAAYLSQLVPFATLPRAVTWGSTVQALAFVTGPAVAGALIATWGIQVAYAANATLLSLSVVLLFSVHAMNAAERRAASWAAVKEGLMFVKGSPVLLACMGLDLVAVVLGGAAALLPVFAEEVLLVGAEGYGLLAGALEAGALVTSLVLIRLPQLRRAGPLLLGAVVVFGLGTIGFGLSTWFPLSLGLYALCGAADQVSVVLRQSAVQLSTPDALRGRVSAVNMIFIISSNQLSVVLKGFMAAAIGAQATVVSGGVGVLIVVLLVALFVPSLARFQLPSR